jgi:hypothetical protein
MAAPSSHSVPASPICSRAADAALSAVHRHLDLCKPATSTSRPTSGRPAPSGPHPPSPGRPLSPPPPGPGRRWAHQRCP